MSVKTKGENEAGSHTLAAEAGSRPPQGGPSGNNARPRGGGAKSGTPGPGPAGARSFPTAPPFYLEALALLTTADASPGEVGAILARDQTILKRLMQVINSAHFGLERRITDAAEAVALLGFDTVKSILIDHIGINEFAVLDLIAQAQADLLLPHPALARQEARPLLPTDRRQ
jgi:hypothetical protein